VQTLKVMKIKNQGKIKEMMDLIRKKEVNYLKEEKKCIRYIQKEKENIDTMVKKNLKAKFKEDEIIKQEKMKYFMSLKQIQLQKYFSKKIREQKQKCEMNEEKIKNLSNLEEELVQKYEQTQERKKKVLENYKNAMLKEEAYSKYRIQKIKM